MGSCWPDVRIPSGKMDLGAFFVVVVAGLGRVCGALGEGEVSAGAILVKVLEPIGRQELGLEKDKWNYEQLGMCVSSIPRMDVIKKVTQKPLKTRKSKIDLSIYTFIFIDPCLPKPRLPLIPSF